MMVIALPLFQAPLLKLGTRLILNWSQHYLIGYKGDCMM